METSGRERRRFLGKIALLAAGLPLLWKFLVPRVATTEALLRVPRTEVPLEGALVYRDSRVALLRTGSEIFALSLVCTHLGCTVNVTPGEIVCPCHGSVFDRHGQVLKGPANRPLKRLEVREEGEDILVLSAGS